jgi:hypothetical protein
MNFKEWLYQEASAGFGKGYFKPWQRNGYGRIGVGPRPGGELDPNSTPGEKLVNLGKDVASNVIGQWGDAFRKNTEFGRRSDMMRTWKAGLAPLDSYKMGTRQITCPYPNCKTKFIPDREKQTGDMINCPKCKGQIEVPEGIDSLKTNQDNSQQFKEPEEWQQFDYVPFRFMDEEKINQALENQTIKDKVIQQCKQDILNDKKFSKYVNNLDWSNDPTKDNIQFCQTYTHQDGRPYSSIFVKKRN